MDIRLPEDILHILCEELRQRRDFATLFNCAVSCKQWAPLALSSMYRMHTEINEEEEDETAGLHQAAQAAFMKWSLVWRSIVLSAMKQTLYPYHTYLRCLDLRDLRSLLRDYKFRDKTSQLFFEGELSSLRYTIQATGPRSGTRTDLNVSRVVEAIGDTIVQNTTMIEEVAGEFTPEALSRWIPQLKRLQRLDLYDGQSLSHISGTQHAMSESCASFASLRVLQWRSGNPDVELGKFIASVRSQSLRSLVTLGDCHTSLETCSSLRSHNQSLKQLQIGFSHESVQAIGLLKTCTALTEVKLDLALGADVEPVCVELVEWLQSCRELRSISLSNAESAPAILTPLLLDENLHFEEILVEGVKGAYNFTDGRAFHQALANQRHLKVLGLKTDAFAADFEYVQDMHEDGLDEKALVQSLCQLKNLRTLQLRGVSDFFENNATNTVLGACSRLELVYLSCLRVDDGVLDTVASLRDLRSITFQGDSSFTLQGLLSLISKLGPGNRNLELAIESAAADSVIPEKGLRRIRKALHEKVQGRLDYVLSRDADASDFSNSDGDWD